MNKEFRSYIREVRLFDDYFFDIFFRGDPKYIEVVIQAIFKQQGIPSVKVKEIHVQHDLVSPYRGVRLDALAIDSKGNRINIEVQRASRSTLVKRARYYSAMIDTNTLEQGQDFDKLPENYVIFITEKDFRGDGKPAYQVERYYVDDHRPFSDGTHIIFVNGQHSGDDPIGMLMHDFSSKGANEMKNAVLAERARFLKETEEGHSEISRIEEAIRDEGRAEGRAEEKNSLAKRMLELGSYTMKQIAELTGLSQKKLRELKATL